MQQPNERLTFEQASQKAFEILKEINSILDSKDKN